MGVCTYALQTNATLSHTCTGCPAVRAEVQEQSPPKSFNLTFWLYELGLGGRGNYILSASFLEEVSVLCE